MIGVLYTADKLVLLSIFISFFYLIFLFRTPKNIDNLHAKNVYTVLIMICILTNFVNIAAAYVYPKVLLVHGFDEEEEVEKSRKLSRDMLSESVTINLIREFLRNDARQVTAINQLQHTEVSGQEAQLLNELELMLVKKPLRFKKLFHMKR
jgi:hypothetical protein